MNSKDHWAFVKTIMDNPLDPFPRLVFADWLSEQGQRNAEQRQREVARHLPKAVMLSKHNKTYIVHVPRKNYPFLGLILKTDGAVDYIKFMDTNLIARVANSLVRDINKHITRYVIWVSEEILQDAREAARTWY